MSYAALENRSELLGLEGPGFPARSDKASLSIAFPSTTMKKKPNQEMISVSFSADNLDKILPTVTMMTARRKGWVNLRPQADEYDRQINPGIVASIFRVRGPDLPLMSWVIPRPSKTLPEVDLLGILHPQGQQLSKRFGEFGLELPSSWRVKQDHPNRGLVLEIPANQEPRAILTWLVGCGQALSTVELNGYWTLEAHEID